MSALWFGGTIGLIMGAAWGYDAWRQIRGHQHEWMVVGQSLTGWTLLECECGETELGDGPAVNGEHRDGDVPQ